VSEARLSPTAPPAGPPADHESTLLTTPLHALHTELGARLVPFAGYSMPVQYPMGVLKEHLHTCEAAGLFDVSHMGQVRISGARAGMALESLVPMDLLGLQPGQQRYAFFTSDDGGILDDLMVARLGADEWFLVINASRKAEDLRHLRTRLPADCIVEPLEDRALLALQGPAAHAVLARLVSDCDFSSWTFMHVRELSIAGQSCLVSRSGYTGEDGFEISLAAHGAEALARQLLAETEVAPIGLGARDSLRLEAGLCLYGHDIDTTTSPVEASLNWAIQKIRRTGGARAGGFPGALRILAELQSGTARRRIGLTGIERTPVREGSELIDAHGSPVGKVTSGGFAPSANMPVALAYVPTELASPGTLLHARVRNREVPMRVTPTPFVAQRYYRG